MEKFNLLNYKKVVKIKKKKSINKLLRKYRGSKS